MRVTVPQGCVSDLCFTAEQLLTDLLASGELVAAASVSEAVEDLRRRVREENGEQWARLTTTTCRA